MNQIDRIHRALKSVDFIEQLIPKEGGDIARDHIHNIRIALHIAVLKEQVDAEKEKK
jgi:hypothetical protein